MPKRTFQPNRRHRAKTHGFLTRMKTKAGAAVLSRRRAKGRHKIAVSAGLPRLTVSVPVQLRVSCSSFDHRLAHRDSLQPVALLCLHESKLDLAPMAIQMPDCDRSGCANMPTISGSTRPAASSSASR